MRSDDVRGVSDKIKAAIRSVVTPVIFAIASIVFGTAGYYMYLPTLPPYNDASTIQIISEGIFRSFGFLVLSMRSIESADLTAYTLITFGRLFGLIFFFYAAVAGIGLLFAKQIQQSKIRFWSVLGALPIFDDRGHVIVCGVGDNGYALATEAVENGRNVIAIDTEQNERTEDLKRKGAVVVSGDASHRNVLTKRARIRDAADIFVTTGNDDTNGAIVETIDRIAKDFSWPQVIDVTARINSHRLRQTLHDEAISTEGYYLRTFGVAEATARELLASQPIDDIDNPNERIHVWLVGWTTLSLNLLNQLLHLMHYPDGIDRQVTVITNVPSKTERDIRNISPGIRPEWWDDESMSKFVDDLFPNIDVRSLPASDMELLSDQFSLYDSLQPNDKLTIIADDPDDRSLRALISVWGPKIDNVSNELDLDTQLIYRSSDNTSRVSSLSDVQTDTYTTFVDGCSISSVRGKKRDRIARQLALVYHFLYEENPSDILPMLDSVPFDQETDIKAAIEWLKSLPQADRERYETAVWRNLPEYQRESNRHAADHAAVKDRMANVLEDVNSTVDQQIIRTLADSEHRRWCAEKIINGWEPLPDEKEERWETEEGEQALRDQRYHPDICPVESLRAEMDEEWEKDVSQVNAVLNYLKIVRHRTD